MTDASNAAITSQTDIANLQSFRYRGYYYDSNSGFYYLQSRYYDPVTHRFINAVGLVSTGTGVLGFNMFAYCENNPVNCSDPSGLKAYAHDFIGPLRPGDYRLPSFEDVLSGKSINYIPAPNSVDITERLNNAIISNAKETIDVLNNEGFFNAAFYFIDKVQPGGDWDFKSSWNLYEDSNYKYYNYDLRYDDIGNIHYGFVGRVLFSEELLSWAGGAVQLYTCTFKLSYIASRFDDPRDQKMIFFGSLLWDKWVME